MQGTNWSHFIDWLKTLLFRWPTQVPAGVFWAWLVLWAASIFIFLLGLEYRSSGLKTLLGEDSAATQYLPVRIFGA